MSDEFHVEVVYTNEMTHPSITADELDLLESMLPELVLMAQRFDDSDED